MITISADFPTDISGGAADADLTTAAMFAWQEFIALSWPAAEGTRDTADQDQRFGDATFTGPLVWETFRHKVEIYPGEGPPPGFNPNTADFGYDTVPPQYTYKDGPVNPCPNQTPPATPAWVNLDEISQIGLDSIFAGVLPSDPSADNSAPQLIRFLAKANSVHYEYVVDPANNYWDHSENYQEAVANFEKVASANGTPARLEGRVIDFPDGTVEVKAAFRSLTTQEASSGRFYQTRVRYYEQDKSDPNRACYVEATWGLVGLHIIHKTPTAPSFVFATFEQADNILLPDGTPVEDEDGNVINPVAGFSTTPPLMYEDGDPPSLTIVGDFCSDIQSRLFYSETIPPFRPNPFGPAGGDICVDKRTRAIPSHVIEVNTDAHTAIAAYNEANGLSSSPWLFYKLVNVQWRPFDVTTVNFDLPNSTNNAATFYQANSVVETDYTLQNFSGQFSSDGAPTNLPPNFDEFDPTRGTFQNVLLFDSTGKLGSTYNMGGCMGCHGNAQNRGNDFSFILSDGPNTDGPEAPGVTLPGATNPYPQPILPP
jgi:hypothetical protein